MKKLTNKKKIILGSLIGILLGSVVSVTYAFFSYSTTGANQQLVAGDIYMAYKESSTNINISDMMPRSTKPSDYFEFTIEGKNTYTEKDIIYDINILHGDTVTGKTRIRDEFLRFTLEEKLNGENSFQEVVTNTSYVGLQNALRIWNGTIDAETNSHIVHTYRLYVWIDSGIEIYGGDATGDYSQSEWNNLFASIKVTVTGDFQEKAIPTSLYDVVRTGAVSDSGIHFYEMNGTDNGNGKFVRSTTTSDTYPIYYYRGNVDNNNVVFANKCWKIVRTTETGGTKMIYNGEQQHIIQYNDRSTYTNVNTTGNQFEFDTTTNEWKVTLAVPSSGGNSGEAKITFSIATPGTHTIRYTMPSSGPVTLNRGSTSFGSAGTNQTVTLENVTKDEIFTIAYTHYNTPGAKIEVKFAIADVAIDTGKITCDNEGTSSQLPLQAWNPSYKSPAYVGYNYGTTAYEYSTANWTSGALFGSSYTWNGTSYKLVDATETTPNATHHYSCNATNSDATCSDLRYVYYMSGSTKYYITLQNGKGVEDALKEMLSESTDTIKSPIHETINTWYNTNIKNSYGTYVEDTAWCNDRSIGSLGGWNPNGGALTGSSWTDYSLLFSSYTRYQNPTGTNGIQTTNSPVLTCSNPNDVMSVANRKLENPVALLTYDEANLAGLIYSTRNVNNYLTSGSWYWLLSPSYFYYNDAIVGSVDSSGNLGYNGVNNTTRGVRPALSLKHGTLVYDGDGSLSNPYIAGTPRT